MSLPLMHGEQDICVKKKKYRMLYSVHLFKFQLKQEGTIKQLRNQSLQTNRTLANCVKPFYESVPKTAETTETNYTIKTKFNTIRDDLTFLVILALYRAY